MIKRSGMPKRVRRVFNNLKYQINAIKERDPAAKSTVSILFNYPGLHAVMWHRVTHWLYRHKRYFCARLLSQWVRTWTGVEIHPGATIGRGLFIDHGMGVVIGETTEIGDDCTIYQGVTLGGTGKETGKRHPTLGNNVMVGAGAKVLGPFRVGDNSKIAANAVVLSEVPDNCTCVGIPGRIVRINNQKVKNKDLDQIHMPDPVSMELCRLLGRIERLEKLESQLDEALGALQPERNISHEDL